MSGKHPGHTHTHFWLVGQSWPRTRLGQRVLSKSRDGGLTPEMSEAAPEAAAPEAEAEAADSGTEAGGSAPKVLGLGFAALKSESGNTHICSFVSSVGTCG